MTEEKDLDKETEKTTKQRAVDWFFQQGTTVMVLLVVSGFLGWYVYTQFPQRDAAWAKVVSEQAAEFAKSLEDRDKRFIEYRLKSDEKYAATVAGLIASHEKDYDRLERLLTNRINMVEKHSEATAKRVDTLMP